MDSSTPHYIRFHFVRTAASGDLEALYRAAGWWKEDSDDLALIPRILQGSFAFLVARNAEGRIIGMGRILSDGVSDAYIQDVTVLPLYRGQGLGAEIVQRLVEHCREAKLTWIGLVAEPGTESFYRRLGFTPLEGYLPMKLEQP